MKKHQYVKVDSRNRICLSKISKNLPDLFRVRVKDNMIILEPVQEIPERERWLFRPENKAILDQIREKVNKEDLIDKGSFAEYLED